MASLLPIGSVRGPVGPTGPSAARATAVYTTASLAQGATETGTITLAAAYRLLQIVTSAPARVRLYATAAFQAADAARPVGTDPTGDHGVVFEFVTTDTALSAALSPLVDGASLEAVPVTPIPITITNDGATGAVTATFVYIRTE